MAVNFKNISKLFSLHGSKDVVISPGSRNAPLIEAFSSNTEVNCFSVIDERSAAFFALGRSLRTQKASILCCTSGSAAPNYAPAISEAYYQGVPMIVLTADRPKRWINQQEGQSIDQKGIFHNYVKASFELPEDLSAIEDHNHATRIINEACLLAHNGRPGPVHINIPMEEPLYGREDSKHPIRAIKEIVARNLADSDFQEIKKIWEKSTRVMILLAQLNQDPKLEELMLQFAASNPGVVVLNESLSNIYQADFINCIDRVIDEAPSLEKFAPELVISLGEALVSKKLKTFLRKCNPKEHWVVKEYTGLEDTFNSLSLKILSSASEFLNQANLWAAKKTNEFSEDWQALKASKAERHQSYMENIEYSDFKVFDQVLNQVPEDFHIHYGNSTVIRYAQLFDLARTNNQFGNRGTSGIDGCTSTAIGASSYDDQPSLLISGDVAFQYDSNAFLNHYISKNLRILVINNGGGNIFQIIQGPEKLATGKEFLSSAHKFTAEGIALRSMVKYMTARNEEELESRLQEFFELETEQAVILEVFTDPDISSKSLKAYFEHLKFTT